jgi:hypothetical protein
MAYSLRFNAMVANAGRDQSQQDVDFSAPSYSS